MNFKHLRYFWTAAKAGGIMRAGEQLNTTPQTLSGQIKQLEEWLGHDLFKKRGRGLELTSEGRVALDGRALTGWTPAELARRRAVLPQSPSLGFDLSVQEVVAMGTYPFPELAPAPHAALLRQALQRAGAADLAERRYLGLSGGEQQRVQFARVLAQVLACHEARQYRALLLDEPTASLDPRHQLLLLACGRTVALGTPGEVLTPQAHAQVYDLPASVLAHPLLARTPLVVFSAGT